MVADIVKIGDKIELIEIKNDKSGINFPKHYFSKVISFLESNQLVISAPMENGILVPLEMNNKYNLCFFTAKGLFECRGEIKESYKIKGLDVLAVEFLTELEKYQRRKYYRLKYVADIKYRIFDSEKEELEDLINWIEATLTDISGGGIRFITDKFHEKGDKIILKLTLPINEKMNDLDLYANIISSVKLDNRPNFYQYRAEFFDIDTHQREAVIKFIFEEERKIRRREKGLI